MKILAPSILTSDMLNLGDEIKKIEKSGAEYVHIDVMDGVFVPNISFGMPVIAAVRKSTDLILDVHAMITSPEKYIHDFIVCGADIITFHVEATDSEGAKKIITEVKKEGKKVGISLKPQTPVQSILPYIEFVDMVLVMTVEPGFGGQKFMNETMNKVKQVRLYSQKIGKNVDIEVDGGINIETIKIASDAGANIFVIGTAFFGNKEIISSDRLLSETYNEE